MEAKNNDLGINWVKWSDENSKPKAIIQISHGMAEHIERYSDFAQFMVSNGFIVYGNNHRGHGQNALNAGEIGFFAETDGWNKVVKDMKVLNDIVHEENPDIPVILLGHSMGSFLSRTYIYMYGTTVDGVILSGTGNNSSILVNFGILTSKLEIMFRGKRHKSKFMDSMSFGGFNKKFKPNRTKFDWLSRDEKEVDKYINDQLCGQIFTVGFFLDMLTGVKELNKPENLKKIPRNLPLFFIAGGKDPVGNNSKGVIDSYNIYENIGINNLKYKIYKDARHEILNEINRQEVYDDILDWIDNQIL